MSVDKTLNSNLANTVFKWIAVIVGFLTFVGATILFTATVDNIKILIVTPFANGGILYAVLATLGLWGIYAAITFGAGIALYKTMTFIALLIQGGVGKAVDETVNSGLNTRVIAIEKSLNSLHAKVEKQSKSNYVR